MKSLHLFSAGNVTQLGVMEQDHYTVETTPMNAIKRVTRIAQNWGLSRTISGCHLKNFVFSFCQCLAALSSLPSLCRLIVCCHSDCHVVDEKSAVELSALIDQVSYCLKRF